MGDTNSLVQQAGSYMSANGVPNAWYLGSLNQTAVPRGNVFEPGAGGSVSLWYGVSNSLIEGNVAPAVEIRDWLVRDVLVRHNFSNSAVELYLRNDSPQGVLVAK